MVGEDLLRERRQLVGGEDAGALVDLLKFG
jgi:hypothetical protein